ncbi:unnamed protein product [Heligmosomoides polygyrus]|uniref:LysR_substrate domain-containing protein n=1 Tax=Heligmosomoides polygyrus TaxID=6339 RepID=A0A183FPX1_HELPZ|nr:unnamed protein product [Heligmosomoides polygyrus]
MSVPPRDATGNGPHLRADVSKTRVATLNVGTLSGRSFELAEALERRKAVLCDSPRTIGGVGIIVSERFRDTIASVERFSDCLMKIIVAIDRMYHLFSAYAP